MAKVLKETVYLDGYALYPGTELTDEQAKRITNPNALEEQHADGEDGSDGENADREPKANRDAAEGEGPARKAAPSKAAR